MIIPWVLPFHRVYGQSSANTEEHQTPYPCKVMDDQIPATGSTEPTPQTPSYKDRTAGLVIFGILTIVLGCVAALFVLLMLAGQMAAGAGDTRAPTSAIISGMSVYVIMAVALVWLGIGSIMARRWARALLLVGSWSWLVLGIFTMVFVSILMPKILAHPTESGTSGASAPPAAEMVAVFIVMFLMLGFIFILLPVAWIIFYGSRHVKATCEAKDPVTRWTDACPLPVLALCLWLLFAVPMMLIMPLTGHCVMPFFGIFVTGLPASVFCLTAAAIWCCAAWLLYKLQPAGWWLILIAMAVFFASSLATFAQRDIFEMYQLMGYPDAQIEQMKKFNFLTGYNLVWLTALSVIPFLGYLLFIRKYFFHTNSGQTMTTAA